MLETGLSLNTLPSSGTRDSQVAMPCNENRCVLCKGEIDPICLSIHSNYCSPYPRKNLVRILCVCMRVCMRVCMYVSMLACVGF